jgi:squalene-hopene/tetraprenyl-beta-curcumene cyclase
MHNEGSAEYAESLHRALDWLVGMQSRDGGFAAFDVDNTHYYLNAIPFADHGALLDPPTSDVTARVVTLLARAGRPQDAASLARAVENLRTAQEPDGSWFGRWGTNYIYGTWSVLTALAAAGVDARDACVRRAVAWFCAGQHADGGWGESNDSYLQAAPAHAAPAATPFPTTACSRPARRTRTPYAAGRCISSGPSSRTVCGTIRATPRPAFHGCSI